MSSVFRSGVRGLGNCYWRVMQWRSQTRLFQRVRQSRGTENAPPLTLRLPQTTSRYLPPYLILHSLFRTSLGRYLSRVFIFPFPFIPSPFFFLPSKGITIRRCFARGIKSKSTGDWAGMWHAKMITEGKIRGRYACGD